VFGGDKGAPYLEADPTAPLGVYGRSKRAGEDEVHAAGGRGIILRTAWVYDGDGKNFLRTMLRLARDREEIGVVDDQHGAPTFADDIADATLALAARWRAGESLPLLLHLTNAGEATWCGFATAIMEEAAARGLPKARIKPIATKDYPTKARRPADSRLSGKALAACLGAEQPHWRAALTACFDRAGAQIAAF
jgi:dTDP-4-dehydrorhamnose reductase